MAFCTNCGERIEDDVKFCPKCGQATNHQGKESKREEYSGKIIKCPNCGEAIKSFVSHCPSCGYEFRGTKSSEIVQDFTFKLSQAESEEQKATLLRSFPIPNTKEDIFEFMILAVSNVNSNDDLRKNMSEAWLVKFEQSYQKASLLFKDDSDFFRIQKMYDEGHKSINDARKRNKTKNMLTMIIRNIAVCVGVITVIVAVIVDKTGRNASMIELIGYIVLIVSACTLAKRNASMIDFGIGALSGAITIGLSFLLDNGSMGELSGGIILIIIAVNFFKSVGNNKNENEG